jgi:hypothetical protein
MAFSVPPILFLIFNRPSTAETVFQQIRAAKPKKLFIAADGPRPDRPDDDQKCRAARTIAEKVDWDCEVKTLFREDNLGCGKAVSEAITWFFDHVDEGIILEDDTKPAPEFFRFCAEMLEHYRNDDRVMQITGSSFNTRLTKESTDSYFFSDWDYVWGWATWKRAWRHYDYRMTHYPEVSEKRYLDGNYTSLYERYYTQHMLQRSYYENDDVTWWSVQWGFVRRINSGLVIVPTKNMIKNLGFGNEATNTFDGSEWSDIRIEKMEFPLKHPQFVVRDISIDKEVFKKYYSTFSSRVKSKLKHFTPVWFYDFFKNIFRKYFSLMLIDEYIPTVVAYVL